MELNGISWKKCYLLYAVGVQRTRHITVITGTHQLSHGRLKQNPSSTTQQKVSFRKKFYLQFWFCLNSNKIYDSECVPLRNEGLGYRNSWL